MKRDLHPGTSSVGGDGDIAGSAIQRGFDFAVSLAALAMMVHVTAYFLARFFLSYPLPATLETVAIYYMVILVFGGLVRAVRDGLISVTMLVSWLAEPGRTRLSRLAWGATAVYVSVLAFAAFQKAVRATGDGEVVDTAFAMFPVWPSRWFVVGCLILVAIFAGGRALRGDVDKAHVRPASDVAPNRTESGVWRTRDRDVIEGEAMRRVKQ